MGVHTANGGAAVLPLDFFRTGGALRAAKFPRVNVVRSRGGHYDVYPRGRDYVHAMTVQLDFLATLGFR